MDRTSEEDGRTFTEQIDVAASELVDKTKEFMEEGNVRRLIIRNQDGEVLLEVLLTAGVPSAGRSPSWHRCWPPWGRWRPC